MMIVDFMLETVSQYTPNIPQDDILKCASLDAVWKVVRLANGLETTGALLNNVWNVTRKANETPQALWSRLKRQYDDALLRINGLTYIDNPLDHNEDLSPTLHNVIILHWLQLIHPKMRDMVTQRFSKELRNATYASIFSEIMRSIDSFLKDLSDESASVCSYRNDSSYNTQRDYRNREPGRFSWRGRGNASRLRDSPSNRSSNKHCDYCRLTGRRA